MEDYLARDGAPLTPELWNAIDAAVVDAAKETLTGRRFIPLHGPLGPGADAVAIDTPGKKQEAFEDGFAVMQGRQLQQLPQLFEDFWLYWRDLEAARRNGLPFETSAARIAAAALARREDHLVFHGAKALGIDGLLTVKGVNSLKRGDWAAGENAFTDVAAATALLHQKGRYGRHTLVLSTDLFVQLQRIQPGTGTLESERIKQLTGGRLYTSPVLDAKTALLVCAQPQYLDLAVGQDIATAYTEQVDLNHHFRVLETALPRIKSPDAIVVFK